MPSRNEPWAPLKGPEVPTSLAAAVDAVWSKAEQFGNDIDVKAEGASCIGRQAVS